MRSWTARPEPQAYDPNHYEGFSGKNEFYNFKFLGEKNMLCAINVGHSPDIQCPTDGGASHCPDPWEIRHNFLIEARPRVVSARSTITRYFTSTRSRLRNERRHLRSFRPVVQQLRVLDLLLGPLRA